jgi:quinohemoprotein ethanol dehydrogenase
MRHCGFPIRNVALLFLACFALLDSAGWVQAASDPEPTSFGRVDASRLAQADADPGQWLTNGRDGGGTYYSTLTQIDQQTVVKLGFSWQYALGTSRGLEATPIVVDGVMFAVGNFGRVYALDAATGKALWTFVPELDNQWIRYACCDAVNRGSVVWQGRVYVGAIDGYLYALDAKSGATVWKTDTLLGRDKHIPYTITGAPVVTRDAVVIGNGGADYPGVRGYISAYDRKNGRLRWRFFTVPRDPALGPQDQPHLVEAAKTWDPRHQWEAGGGGNVWDGLAYDPKYDLVFLGTANVSPYNTRLGGRKGGDELYGASVIAVHAASGAMAWYYQEVPDDRWDLDATEKFILTTLAISGRQRDVLLHAPKNGFFYVYDRATGEVLSAKGYTYVNWTKGLDPTTHRPKPNSAAEYNEHPALVWPSVNGAHSWQPMSFDAATGLVYIPAIEVPNVMVELSNRPAKSVEGYFTALGILPSDYDPAQTQSLYGQMPSLEDLQKASPGPVKGQGMLKAWDPVAGRVVWEAPSATIWDGGIMSTAGNLVFHGDARGFLNVFAADSGKPLASIDIGTSIMAAPMTYMLNGVQYVAFMAGYGGGNGFVFPPDTAAYKYGNAGRIIALRLGGGAVPKPPPVPSMPFERPPAERGSAQQIAAGEILYNRFCSRCHVFDRGLLPDLRRMSTATNAIFYEIVLRGALQPKGMGRWDDVLSQADAERIHAYIIDQSWKAFEGERSTTQGAARSDATQP